MNEVVAKRLVKKHQMQRSREGAHCLLQIRTAALNNELRSRFEKWHPEMEGLAPVNHEQEPVKLAA